MLVVVECTDLTAASKQKDGMPMKKHNFGLPSDSDSDDDGDIELLSASKATAIRTVLMASASLALT